MIKEAVSVKYDRSKQKVRSQQAEIDRLKAELETANNLYETARKQRDQYGEEITRLNNELKENAVSAEYIKQLEGELHTARTHLTPEMANDIKVLLGDMFMSPVCTFSTVYFIKTFNEKIDKLTEGHDETDNAG